MPPKPCGDRGADAGASGRVTLARRTRRAWTMVRGSALRRRIIIFNLIGLNALVLGVLFLGGSNDAVLRQRGDTLLQTATLMSEVIATRLPGAFSSEPSCDRPGNGVTGNGVTAAGPADGPRKSPRDGPGEACGDSPDMAGILSHLHLRAESEVLLFDRTGRLLARRVGDGPPPDSLPMAPATPMADGLDRIGSWLGGRFQAAAAPDTRRDPCETAREIARDMVGPALVDGAQLSQIQSAQDTGLRAAAPVFQGTGPGHAAVAVVAVIDAPDALDRLARADRERVLRIFLIATLISVGLSLTLASTISVPLADLATAAETGRDRSPKRRGTDGGRVRIPDLTARPDEIGRLSDSLRGMVDALYHRIESNEQFAADVAHEIKNPLASLRSAVVTLRGAERADQRARLLEVIEHDVRRLDRLVSDISNASRLDSELVKEDQTSFDLLAMLRNLGQYMTRQANEKEVAFITDFPDQPIFINGLEARLAQVFVNLISNAISFCDTGDAIRVWARRRASRVLVVVEDTGPGIPAEALEKVFDRFYSNRPAGDFGNNTGLGLAISKQIVEAHDGVIWAENIRPTEADATSDPLGVRFVVGLSV